METDATDKNDGSPLLKVLRYFGNTIIHQMIATITVVVIWVAIINYSTPFSWHVILCMVGFTILIGEGIVLFAPENVWTLPLSRKEKSHIHASLVCLGSALNIVGVILEIDRQGWDAQHFETSHGLTGIIATFLTLLAFVLGGLVGKRLPFKQVIIKVVHNLIGMLTLVIGIISILFSYDSNWFVYFVNYPTKLTLIVVTSVLLILLLLGGFRSLYSQIKSLMD